MLPLGYFRVVLALVVLVYLVPLISVHATITVVSDWRMGESGRMGESDPGVISGEPATFLVDATGWRNLNVQGPASYQSDVGVEALAHTASFLCVDFTGSSFASNSIVSTAVDNFGIEAWVNPTEVTSDQIIAYNGDTATSGWGIMISGSAYSALYGGKVIFSAGTAVPGVWTHVAVVRDNGTSTLYVNGVAITTSPATPNVPVDNFAVGAPPLNPDNQFFTGLIDEVRVFTFAAGQFSNTDLLINSTLTPVATEPASAITGSTATLSAVVQPGGVATGVGFDWGSTTGYGHTITPVTLEYGTNPVAVTQNITGLQAGTVYHFRASSTNSTGRALSWDRSFVAPALIFPGGTNFIGYLRSPFTNSITAQLFTNSTTARLFTVPLAISSGDGQFCMALKGDGMVTVWGDNSGGQTNVPVGLNDVIAIAAGNLHCLALHRDGTVTAWGSNASGQTNVPAGLANVVAIAAGGNVSLALKGDGTVAAWGQAGLGQTSVPAGLSNVVGIAASLSSAAALTAQGTVATWGQGANYAIPANATNVAQIAAGSQHFLALRRDGSVVAWGADNAGQVDVPASVTNALVVSAAGDGSLALLSNGNVVAWGSDDGSKDNTPSDMTNAVAIAAGGLQNFAMRADGTVIGWGDNLDGQFNIPAGLTNVSGLVLSVGGVNVNIAGVYEIPFTTHNFLGATGSATITVTIGVPALTVNFKNVQQPVISWPAAASGYVLQQSPGISPASWVTVGTINPYIVSATNSAMFYRLSHP